ncbi:hypothetical protein D3C87_172170 [compost metagenome]
MKYLKIIIVFLFSAVLFSCGEDEQQRQAETIKAAKQNDSILKVISSNWKFNVPTVTPKVTAQLNTWSEWQQFKNELFQKPTGSITAYKQKTKNLVTKVDQLKNNIPPFFDKPQVRARISVLITKIKSLYTYISIDVIPDKKVVKIINEVTHEMTSLQNQFDEIVRKSEIPKEIGEEEMLRALDTVRMANPDAIQPVSNTPPPSAVGQGLSRKRI